MASDAPPAETTLRRFEALLFDLDGVITKTAAVHSRAWKALFDEFLRRWSDEHGEPFRPFEIAEDYVRYVDGRRRYDGVASFLGSRGIELPVGDPSDGPDEPNGVRARQPEGPLLPRRGRGSGRRGVRRRRGAARRRPGRRQARRGRVGQRELRPDPAPGWPDRPLRRARHRPSRRRRGPCAASPRPTRSSRRRSCWASPPPGPSCSRTPSPGCRRARPAASASSSGSTGDADAAHAAGAALAANGADIVLRDLTVLIAADDDRPVLDASVASRGRREPRRRAVWRWPGRAARPKGGAPS